MLAHYKPLIAILVLFLSISDINGQDFFSGYITYEMSYAGSQIDLATREQLPEKAEVTAKEEMVRIEMHGGELKQIEIKNFKEETSSSILEILREEYVIHKGPEDIERELNEMGSPEINFTNETKTILGYKCKKAEVVVTNRFGEEEIIEIYYTEEIPGQPFNFNLPYRGIPGLMLQYEIRIDNLNIQYKATEINSRWRLFISDRNFRLPDDAKEVTFEELQEMVR